MRTSTRPLWSAAFLAAGLLLGATCAAGPAAPGMAAAPLRLVGQTELPGYSGDFDHFAYDLKGNRLFLAAEDHATLEVFDLRSGAHLKTIGGFDAPHSILYLPKHNRLLVTDSGGSLTKLLDAASYKIVGTVKLTPGADSVGYDAVRNRLYVDTGGKNAGMKESFLAEIDPDTGRHYGDLKFDAEHIEAMAVEQHGNRLFINVTDKNYVAVVDKRSRSLIGTWPIEAAQQNAMAALDEANHRLFIVTRKPGRMVVLDSDSGAAIATFPAPGRADQVEFDQSNRRLYVLGGDGAIGIYQENDPNSFSQLADFPTTAGAKTGILVPELNRLFVAVSPGEGKDSGAQVLQFAVTQGAGGALAQK